GLGGSRLVAPQPKLLPLQRRGKALEQRPAGVHARGAGNRLRAVAFLDGRSHPFLPRVLLAPLVPARRRGARQVAREPGGGVRRLGEARVGAGSEVAGVVRQRLVQRATQGQGVSGRAKAKGERQKAKMNTGKTPWTH